jgi:uncharacterized membrane protein YbaN (DUF454 family)
MSKFRVNFLGKKLLFLSLGLVFSAIAIAGVWLPGIPTVGPLLVALWAFGKSSNKAQNWLKRLPMLKSAFKQIEAYEKHRSVSKQVKIIAQACAWGSVVLVFVVTKNVWLALAVAALAAACSWFMLKTPTLKPVRN